MNPQTNYLVGIFSDLLAERQRQDAALGEHNLAAVGAGALDMHEVDVVPLTSNALSCAGEWAMTARLAERIGTVAHASLMNDRGRLREELVRVMATAAAFIEYLDRDIVQ
jgi:hypothetical protein